MKFGRNLTSSGDPRPGPALPPHRAGSTTSCSWAWASPGFNMHLTCSEASGAAARRRHHAPAHLRSPRSGRPPVSEQLAASDLPIRLALSLHAPEDGLRSEIMPVNDRYPIAEILAATDSLLRAAPPRMVFIEYVMLAGVNDSNVQARGSSRELLDPRKYKVNLIPYNPTGFYDGLLARRDRRVQGRRWRSTACARPSGSRAGATSTRRAGSWRRRRWRPPDRRGPGGISHRNQALRITGNPRAGFMTATARRLVDRCAADLVASPPTLEAPPSQDGAFEGGSMRLRTLRIRARVLLSADRRMRAGRARRRARRDRHRAGVERLHAA